ncbi:hypothetical protein ACFL49_00905 [Candidatus Omnitrophota bacterium]
MKRMLQICKDCGYEEEVNIYSHEEAQQQRLRTVNPCCKKCGSPSVELK